ncbi:GNAT family N-acetyltransferase [Actibacterium sp. D379-3]
MDSDAITFRDLAIGDAGWLIQRHAELYAAHDGFDATFEPLVAEILVDYMRNRDPDCERAWIAHCGDQRLGSIFCVREGTPGVAKLRLFLIEPAARGHGLGHTLLGLCMEYARATGYRRLTLWTHESHKAACALYAAHGFRRVKSVPVRSFGQDLVEQSWEIDL